MINKINIRCDKCDTEFEVSITAATTESECPSCKNSFYVVSASRGAFSTCSVCNTNKPASVNVK